MNVRTFYNSFGHYLHICLDSFSLRALFHCFSLFFSIVIKRKCVSLCFKNNYRHWLFKNHNDSDDCTKKERL